MGEFFIDSRWIEPCRRCPNRFELSEKCYQGRTCFACPKYRKYHNLGGEYEGSKS